MLYLEWTHNQYSGLLLRMVLCVQTEVGIQTPAGRPDWMVMTICSMDVMMQIDCQVMDVTIGVTLSLVGGVGMADHECMLMLVMLPHRCMGHNLMCVQQHVVMDSTWVGVMPTERSVTTTTLMVMLLGCYWMLTRISQMVNCTQVLTVVT